MVPAGIEPKKEPEKEPVMDTPVAPVVASMLPEPLIALVLKLRVVPPPITTDPEVKLSTFNAANSAELPDTTTFFHVAILICFSYYKYILYAC
jgi:hypothetical protein